MNERFTIDDMIEFCKSELDYYEKNRDRVHKEYFDCGRVDSPHSLVLGMYSGQAIAYNLIRDQLIKLKEQSDDKKD